MISLTCGILKNGTHELTETLQNRNRVTDVENKFMSTRRVRVGMNWETEIIIRTYL